MATNTNTLKTRIQLKSDTEANWDKVGPKDGSPGFVPLLGELIVYVADAAHSFSRLKIGDGNTNVVNLPFIDAGTINGDNLPEDEIKTYANTSLFPQPGIAGKLYVDLSTSTIYCFANPKGYTKLSNFTYNISKTDASHITYWRSGDMTSLKCEDGMLKTRNGILPSLAYETIQVVRDITKEGTT